MNENIDSGNYYTVKSLVRYSARKRVPDVQYLRYNEEASDLSLVGGGWSPRLHIQKTQLEIAILE